MKKILFILVVILFLAACEETPAVTMEPKITSGENIRVEFVNVKIRCSLGFGTGFLYDTCQNCTGDQIDIDYFRRELTQEEYNYWCLGAAEKK